MKWKLQDTPVTFDRHSSFIQSAVHQSGRGVFCDGICAQLVNDIVR